MNSDLEKKIKNYETFLNETLRGDLLKIGELQQDLMSEITSYEEIKQLINAVLEKKITDDKGVLKTQIDLGCNFYVKAKILSTKRILLYVGLNFYLEFELDEALKFIDNKQKFLNEKNEKLINQSCEIKAYIKVVLDTLAKLQGIEN